MSKTQRAAFLAALENECQGNVTLAAAKVGISRVTAWRMQKSDEKFAAAVQDAIEMSRKTIGDLAVAKTWELVKNGYWPAVNKVLNSGAAGEVWVDANRVKLDADVKVTDFAAWVRKALDDQESEPPTEDE